MTSSEIKDFALHSGIADFRERTASRIVFYDVSNLFPFATLRLHVPVLAHMVNQNVAFVVQPADTCDVNNYRNKTVTEDVFFCHLLAGP